MAMDPCDASPLLLLLLLRVLLLGLLVFLEKDQPAIVVAAAARAPSRPAGLSRESGTILRPRQTLCREAAPHRKGSPGRAPATRFQRILSWCLQSGIRRRNRARSPFECVCRPQSSCWSGRNPPSRYAEEAPRPTHAWVEALLPHIGWVGFDPTNNLIVGGRHIRTAIGRDYADVSPTVGTMKGSAETELQVRVRVTPSDAVLPPDKEFAADEEWSRFLEKDQQAEKEHAQQQQQQ